MKWIVILSLVAVFAYWMIIYSIERKAHVRCENEIRRLRAELGAMKQERESEHWVDVSSSYIVTDSDVVRFKTSKEICFNARKRIATNIGFDIVKHFQPEESLTETGKTKYTYTFKIRK